MSAQRSDRRIGSSARNGSKRSAATAVKVQKKAVRTKSYKHNGELAADDGRGSKPLRECTEEALRGYFSTINGHEVAGLYEFVLGEVEVPLLRTVLEHTGGNQTRAAEVLGINRGTLRKKLRQYHLDT